jgi:chromosome segregation ATPase
VEETKAIADEKRSKIQGQIEHLQVQLALGKAETRDALESQKKKIGEGISSFETTVDEGIGSLGEVFDELKYVFVDKAHSLEAELDALGVRFDMEKERKKEQFEEKKKEITAKIKELNKSLDEKKHVARDKVADIENEVKEGLERIKNAFRELLH